MIIACQPSDYVPGATLDHERMTMPTYSHVYEDGRRVPAKAYPESLLPDFPKHFREEWLPNRALDYFQRRDDEALQYLPKLIAANKPKKLD